RLADSPNPSPVSAYRSAAVRTGRRYGATNSPSTVTSDAPADPECVVRSFVATCACPESTDSPIDFSPPGHLRARGSVDNLRVYRIPDELNRTTRPDARPGHPEQYIRQYRIYPTD